MILTYVLSSKWCHKLFRKKLVTIYLVAFLSQFNCGDSLTINFKWKIVNINAHGLKFPLLLRYSANLNCF